jgi:ArsR family transcriptional regulator
MLKAMANPVRLQILQLLGEEGAYVCHLSLALRRRQPYISQQLSVLRRAGLVLDERQGLNILYRLSDRRVGEFLDSLALLTSSETDGKSPTPVNQPLAGCLCPYCVRSLGLDASRVCRPSEPVPVNSPPERALI